MANVNDTTARALKNLNTLENSLIAGSDYQILETLPGKGYYSSLLKKLHSNQYEGKSPLETQALMLDTIKKFVTLEGVHLLNRCDEAVSGTWEGSESKKINQRKLGRALDQLEVFQLLAATLDISIKWMHAKSKRNASSDPSLIYDADIN